MIVLSVLVSSGYGETHIDFDMSLECLSAYYQFAFETPRYFEEPVTRIYYGISGHADCFFCHPTVLTLRFHEEAVEGEYTFVKNRTLTVSVKGRVDTQGHLFLQEILERGQVNYEFRGMLTEQEIIGMWEKGDGKKGFDLFATVHQDSPLLEALSTDAGNRQERHATDRRGNTFLHLIARHEESRVVDYILTALDSAHVNARNRAGQTPLHSAIDWKRSTIREEKISGITAIVELLLAHGAEIDARDNNGMTPVDIAQANELSEVVELLQRYSREKEESITLE
jgi:hypothetical protein